MNDTHSHSTIAELQHSIATNADQRAYAQLYYRFAPSLIKFANQWVSDLQASEEIVSDVFMRIWERKDTLDQVQNLRMYLFISVRNFSINYLKSRKAIVLTDFADIPEADQKPELNTPYQITYARQLDEQLHNALKNLPPRCRIIFSLAKEDGLKVKEIAELMQVSPKTVENQITIAFKKLAGFFLPLRQKVVKMRS